MVSNVQFRAMNSSWLRPSWGRSTGARSSEQFADLGEPIELSGGVRGAATHRPDQAASHQGRAVGGASASRKQRFESVPLQQRVSSLAAGPEEPYASALDRSLKRRRLRRGHRWQVAHDRPEPSVGFGLKAAVPSRRDEIVDRVIAGIAQGPHQGFRLVEMAHPVVTPMHDMNGDVPQSGDMVEKIVVIAIRRAAGAKESAIDHVVDEDPGGG
jgi:hypothetical protein